VALFALALIWLIALVTYDATDPVWFFTTGASHPPANFVGRVGAFLAELSFQLFGYASYVIPAIIAVGGWHYFWCQPPDAAYTKALGVTLFFGCASSFLSLLFGSTDAGGKTFFRGWLTGQLAGRDPLGLSQSYRLDHRAPHPDCDVGHPRDTGLAWPDVRARERGIKGPVGAQHGRNQGMV
jgi:hypothetical protein